FSFSYSRDVHLPHLHSFPTRRSSDLKIEPYDRNRVRYELRLKNEHLNGMTRDDKGTGRPKKLSAYFSNALSEQYLTKHVLPIVRDRKSTRLNSSHVSISYAVFCLKKK